MQTLPDTEIKPVEDDQTSDAKATRVNWDGYTRSEKFH